MSPLLEDRIDTPLGPLLVISDGTALCAVDFVEREALVRQRLGRSTREASDPRGFSSALRAWFDGALDALDDLPVDAAGTPFQQQVWAALRTIPSGTTWSYADLARAVGRPRASRAVGAANGRNPVALVVPCHRVIGKDGSLTGYASGVHRKRWLLEHEGALARATPAA